MRRVSPWVVIMPAVLAACLSTTLSEQDVDAARRTDAACATSVGTGSCTERAVSADAAAIPRSDASVAAPQSEEAGPTSRTDAAVSGPLGDAAGPGVDVDAGVTGPWGEGGCEYLNQHFEDGVIFPANDGCNSCQCLSGWAACTLVGCGRRPAHCDLPFDPGSCDESHSYYAHNPSTGLCELKKYSGCGGNLNRFQEYVSCATLCSLSGGWSGRDCTFEGKTYRHAERVARKPSEMTGCGPCLCNDGRVLCPPADCKCPDGHKLGLQCVTCTSAGGCAEVEERCFPACDTDAVCDTVHGLFCDKTQGVCVSIPGCIRDGGFMP